MFNRIHIYGSDHFPIIILYLLFRFLMHYSVSIGLTGNNLIIICKYKLIIDTIELYDEPIVLFTDILCNISNRCMPITIA